MIQVLQNALDGKPAASHAKASARVVRVPLSDWLRGLAAAVAPAGTYEAKLLADLRLGAERAGNVREVGIRSDQLKIVLGLIPAEQPVVED